MKQKLIALLKTSFASKGFNAKELESLADLLISQQSLTDESTDEDLTTVVTNAKPVADFVQSVASRQVSDVKKPKVDPVTTTTDVKADVDPNETPTEKMLRQALEGITALTAEVANIKGEKVATTRKSQYEKALEGVSDSVKAGLLEDFDLLNFKDDEQFNGWLEKKTESAKGFIQDEANSGLGNDRPAGGNGKPVAGEKEVSPAMKELIAEREAKAKASAQNV